MHNRVELIGRLGFTPELRYTNGGQAVTNISVAMPTGTADESGRKNCEFIDVTVWGSAAQGITDHGKKGDMVRVEGNIRKIKKDGIEKPVTEIHANHARRMMFGEPRQDTNATD